jgi:hypothetical protein
MVLIVFLSTIDSFRIYLSLGSVFFANGLSSISLLYTVRVLERLSVLRLVIAFLNNFFASSVYFCLFSIIIRSYWVALTALSYCWVLAYLMRS